MERNEYKCSTPANPWLPLAWLMMFAGGAAYYFLGGA